MVASKESRELFILELRRSQIMDQIFYLWFLNVLNMNCTLWGFLSDCVLRPFWHPKLFWQRPAWVNSRETLEKMCHGRNFKEWLGHAWSSSRSRIVCVSDISLEPRSLPVSHCSHVQAGFCVLTMLTDCSSVLWLSARGGNNYFSLLIFFLIFGNQFAV